MDMIVTSIGELFTRYGARTALIIVLTVVAVNLIKKPLIRCAETLLKKTGADKSLLTRYVTLLPVPVALIFDVLFELFSSGFSFAALTFSDLLSRAVIYGGLAIATYESIKKQLEAYAAKKKAAATDEAGVKLETDEVETDETVKDEAETNETGTKETGTDDAETNDAETNVVETVKAGTDETGTDETELPLSF